MIFCLTVGRSVAPRIEITRIYSLFYPYSPFQSRGRSDVSFEDSNGPIDLNYSSLNISINADDKT